MGDIKESSKAQTDAHADYTVCVIVDKTIFQPSLTPMGVISTMGGLVVLAPLLDFREQCCCLSMGGLV